MLLVALASSDVGAVLAMDYAWVRRHADHRLPG
jgi:hypothetical protein